MVCPAANSGFRLIPGPGYPDIIPNTSDHMLCITEFFRLPRGGIALGTVVDRTTIQAGDHSCQTFRSPAAT